MIRLASFVERFTLLLGLALVLLLAGCFAGALLSGPGPDADWYGLRIAVLLVVSILDAALCQGAAMYLELQDRTRRAQVQQEARENLYRRLIADLARPSSSKISEREYQQYLQDASGVTDPRR